MSVKPMPSKTVVAAPAPVLAGAGTVLFVTVAASGTLVAMLLSLLFNGMNMGTPAQSQRICLFPINIIRPEQIPAPDSLLQRAFVA